jgi:uncharacterized protein (TIGR02147 family)
MEALGRLQRFRAFGENHPGEAKTLRYYSRWYHEAIRELSSMRGTKLGAEEIHARLGGRVPLREIEESLKFLEEHGYLGRGETRDSCSESIRGLALGQFQREMLRIAGEKLDEAPEAKRHVLGRTLAVSPETYEKIRTLMRETENRIAELARTDWRDAEIYHVTLAAFPLTGKS